MPLTMGSCLALSVQSVSAFSFKTNYTAELSGSDRWKGDIWLKTVELQNGKIIDDFVSITSASVVDNDAWTGGDSGAASADLGDEADGYKAEDISGDEIKQVLNSRNLNNIIDTEDSGNAKISLSFSDQVNSVFIWERGMNSKLDIQATDENGNEIGNLIQLDSSSWDYADYRIDTQEISGSQAVGSIGLNLADFGVDGPISGVNLYSRGYTYRGADFKLAGSRVSTPEPGLLLGLGTVAGGLLAKSKRRQNGSS